MPETPNLFLLKEEVVSLELLADRFVIFECAVRICKSNDVQDLVNTLDELAQLEASL